MAKIAPSVLGADFSRLAEDIRNADNSGIDMFHLDIMDGHFVPNISFGPALVKTVNSLSDTFLDVHLMLSEPEKYFEPFIKAGADSITFHIEVQPDPKDVIQQLRDMKCEVGLSLNPDTPVDTVLPYLQYVDMLLVMSVHPGFGGQKFIESALDKIRTARKYISDHSLSTVIQVDGGIGPDNASTVMEAGADILVMGSAFFGSQNRAELGSMVHGLGV